ncbi:MAG: glycosyltransferase family 9 protein [Nitrospiraceae bacterium]|nr:glycosyltransferase family 9 protein [Nitrospiraceae bacterium]
MNNPRILVLPLYGIGDVLMTTPALRNIKEKIPSARVTCLHMSRATRDILIGNPNIDDNIHFPFLEAGRLRGARFLSGFRGRFDVAINFYPSNRKDYNIASFLSGCRIRMGHTYGMHNWRELNFLKNRTLPEDDQLHNVEENLRLLEFLGIKDPYAYPLEAFLAEEEDRAAGGWLLENGIDERTPLVGLHPGTSAFKEHVKRRWPPERFPRLIDGLCSVLADHRFLVFGGPEEAPLKKSITGNCAPSSRGRVHAVETPGIRQAAALVKRCGLFISNDSGLMHMAAAFQVPTVAVFGPTNPRWVSPWMCPSRIMGPAASCAPCFRYSPAPLRCRKRLDFKCLADMSAESVMMAALSLMGRDF